MGLGLPLLRIPVHPMWRKRILIAGVYIVIIGTLLFAVVFARLNALSHLLGIKITDVFTTLPKEKTQDGGITFLIAGIGGDGHDGPTLTDSITLARYDLKTKYLRTVGVPRDVWDPYIQDKINSIYTYGLQQDAVNPFDYTKAKYKELLGVDIDYMVVVDFAHFEKLIDMLGGVTINLEKGFYDPLYPKDGAENEECVPFDPNYGCRYQTLIFRKGTQHLNGAVALKFVRSRHAEGSEGSDFSRSSRQQIILNAIKTRLSEIAQSRDFDTLFKIIEFANANIKRDISNSQALSLVSKAPGMKVASQALSEEFFEVPPSEEFGGRYVLIPKDNDYALLRSQLTELLTPKRK